MSNKIMLNIKTFIYYCLCLNVLLTACQSDVSTFEERGSGLLISLCDDVSIESRATPSDLGTPLVSNFDLKIANKKTGNILYNDKFTEQLIPASQGEYDITASYGDNQELGVNAPYFLGRAEALVEEDKQTRIAISCKVENALTSVVFSNKEVFEKEFSDYALKVSVESKYVLLRCDDGKSAYYQSGTHPTFVFVGTLKDGSKMELPITDDKFQEEETFAAGAHCKITLSINAVSGLKLKIEKIEVEKVTINETIPVAWLPKPKVSGFSDITYVETDDAPQNAVISYTASLPIEDMELTLDMKDEQYSTYSKTYTLTGLSDDDRANLEKLGIELPQVGTAKTGTIDLNNLVGTMQTNAGATVDNAFTLRVKANGRWSDEATPAETYKVEVVKPEFAVSVDERNCWSREFTVDEITATSGNIDKLKSNLVYQYYNGSEWVECANRSNEKGRLQQFASRAEEIATKQYKVRALYRGAIPSNEVTATLETPAQLPNSDMEEWEESKVARSIITYSINNSAFWETNNSYTTRYHSSVGILNAGSNPYNCFPAVSYVVGGHSGNRAAEIRSTASGRGNTLPSNVLNLNKVAGELFTGSVSVTTGGSDAVPSGDHYTIDTNGRAFENRPTALSFWYKYSPVNTDTYRVRIVLMDANHETIISKEFTESNRINEWTQAKLDLSYDADKVFEKCHYIYVVFSSTTTPGSSMQYSAYNSYNLWVNNSLKKFDDTKCWVGSVLTIDDISLVYDK